MNIKIDIKFIVIITINIIIVIIIINSHDDGLFAQLY